MEAAIIAVGSELLGPYRLDTNSLALTDRLNRLGIPVTRKAIVGDDEAAIAETIGNALERCDVVLVTGGLGPTADDLTREAVALLLSIGLRTEESILDDIRRRFESRGRRMPEINARQAMVLEGAEVLKNPRGTAPGQWIAHDGRIIILLPGVPSEMEAIFDEHCRARLERLSGGCVLITRVLKISGLFESEVDEKAAPIYRQFDNPVTTILASPGEIQLHLRATGAGDAQAIEALDALTHRLDQVLGKHIYSRDGRTMEEVVGALLAERQKTVAVAESCTGGLVAERLTRVPGSSNYFLGGVVAYHNEAKQHWLDVPAEVLAAHGAVSTQTAALMAESVRRRFNATYGISVTGIAGPSGGSSEKPVGLVYIALAAPDREPEVIERRFPTGRDRVRLFSSQSALDLLRLRLLA